MTREEAIDRLMWLKGVPHINDDKWIEAIDMAIEALQWQDRILTQAEDILLHGKRRDECQQETMK